MGISLVTALMIQNPENDIRCSAVGPVDRKWAGWISLWKSDSFHTPLLSTQPIYKTEAAAKAAMEKVVEDVKKAELA